MYLLVPRSIQVKESVNRNFTCRNVDRKATHFRLNLKDRTYITVQLPNCHDDGYPLLHLTNKSLDKLLFLYSLGLPESEILSLMEPSNE